MKNRSKFAVVLLASATCVAVHAANVETELPANTYITQNGLDWAWAFPLPAGSGIDLSYQSQFGWRLPTLEELQNAPLAVDFKFAGANVPLGGTDPVSGASFSATNAALDGPAACATPYFSNSYNHCDWQDGNGQPEEPWAGLPGAQSFADQLVVRQGLAAVGEARFTVSKSYSDDREDEVVVTLTCNSGLPLQQSFTIAGDGEIGVAFVVTEIPDSGADCEITESGSPAGYTPVFNGGNGCAWDGVLGGNFTCAITNEANPASFTVTKEWVVEGAVGEEVQEEASVSIYCNNEIDGGYWNGSEYQYNTFLSGDGDFVEVSVDTTAQSAQCRAEESIFQSGVESENDCGTRTIPAGGSSSCTITNTVFFEGIPTLSQWGMAIMALLMLGIGFVGLRRFV